MTTEFEAQEKVLREISYSLFQYQPLNKYLIDGFNEFLSTGLKKVVENSSFTTDILNQQYRFKFSLDGTYTKPEIEKIADKSLASGYPNYYRTYKEDYCFGVKIKIELFDKKDMKLKETFFEGKIPIMLGSDACNSLLETDKEKINECEKDPQGYFIMGFEKALIAQEKTASNFSYNVVQDKKIFCEMLSQNELGFISKITIFERKKRELERKKKRNAQVICAVLTRLCSKKTFLTAVDMLHLSYKVFPGKSQYDNGSLDDYFNYFGVNDTENNDYKQALCDFIGYIYFYTAGNEEGKDFIPIVLENYIANTINASLSNSDALLSTVTKIYEETVPGSSAPTEGDGEEGEEEAPEEEEDVDEQDEEDMLMDVEEKETIDMVVDDEWKKWKKTMEKYFFPHISNPDYKRLVFMNMVVKFMLCSKGLKDIDNRDDFSVKKVETPGILIQNLFAKSIQGIKKKILGKIDAEYKKSEKQAKKDYENNKDNFNLSKHFNIANIDVVAGQKSLSDNSIITDLFRTSFTRDTWGDARTGKKGVTQQVSRFNLPSIYASIRRLSAHSNRQNKIVKPRMIDPSQFMLVAPEETPDNDRIGLMKHFSVSTYVTYEFPEYEMKEFYNKIIAYLHLLQSKKVYNLDNMPSYKNEGDVSTQTLVIYNGEPIGFTAYPQELRQKLIKLRRFEIQNDNLIYRFVSVVLQDETMGPNRVMKYLKINITPGRLIAPFFVINEKTGKMMIDEKQYNNQSIREFLSSIPTSYLESYMRKRKRTKQEREFIQKHPILDNLFEYLLKNGCIEYLDAHEIQFSNIALNLSQLVKDKSMTFSHMLLNPEFMFGVTASLMTFIGHNPTPRISLYVNHIKQAVSFQSEQFLKRMEPHKDKQKIANYSHKRQIGTYMDEIIGTDELTIYQKATVCIYPFKGQTQEDAIMVKKSAIERGLFSSTVYQTYTIENPKQTVDLPDELKAKFEGGVIKEKMEEEKGLKQALFKFNEILEVVKQYYKQHKKLPSQEIALKLEDLNEELETVKPQVFEILSNLNLATFDELNWREEKLQLESQFADLYKKIRTMINSIKDNETIKSYSNKLNEFEKIYQSITTKDTSRDAFPVGEMDKIQNKKQMIETFIQKLEKMETSIQDYFQEEGIDFVETRTSKLQQFKKELDNFLNIFNWLVNNKKISQSDVNQLRIGFLGKDGSIAEYVNEARRVIDERDVYDKFMLLIDNYNLVSENPDMFGKNKNFMDYTKTRKELEQFCKEHDCYNMLDVVEYKSMRETYKEPVKVEMDEILGYVKKDEGEKKILFEGEKGVVDKIQRNPTRGVYRVRIRDFHIAQVGDKIAGPYAQKGVIAAIVPDEDLPCVMETGEVPDVFVNPLAFPSRLTIGMFLEAFLGKVISKVETRRIKDVKKEFDLNFYIPFERTGVPVFKFYNDYIHENHEASWKKILGLRKDFITMVDDDFVKTTDAFNKTSNAIKDLYNKIYKQFLKVDVKYDDLEENDKAFYDKIFGSSSTFSVKKIAITFGQVSENRAELKKLDPIYADQLSSFYRDYFSTDFISLDDMVPDEKEKVLEKISTLKDYGRAFKTYDVKEANQVVKSITQDLGMYGIREKEKMINGETGQLISEKRYKFNSEKAMKAAVIEILTKDFQQLELNELKQYSKWFFKALGELIIAFDELNGEDQEYLKTLRNKIENSKEQELIDRAKHPTMKLILPVFNENDMLDYYMPNVNIIKVMLENMNINYFQNMAEKMKIVDKNGVLDETIANKLKTTDMVDLVEVPIPLTVGVVPYLILKHYVHDKIQERDDGPIDIVTRQSTKGKKNGGGNRFGEMESNAIVAHGVPYFLQERLNKVVDKTKMIICEECGQICSHNARSQTQCPICKTDSKMVSVIAPFSLKMFADFNTAMGIKNFIYTKVIGKDEQF